MYRASSIEVVTRRMLRWGVFCYLAPFIGENAKRLASIEKKLHSLSNVFLRTRYNDFQGAFP